MLGERFDVVPPLDQLEERVRRYRVTVDGAGGLLARDAGSFGSTRPDTALRMVESIAGDAAAGYWVAVDQLMPLAEFHLFRRDALTPVGSFRGGTVSYTDGIALHAAPTRAFPGGALYAVHADRAVAAFDLREVAGALGLDSGCVD